MSVSQEGKKKHEEILGSVLDINLAQCNVSVCLAAIIQKDDTPEFAKLQLTDDLTEEFRSIFGGVIQRYKKEKDSGDLVL